MGVGGRASCPTWGDKRTEAVERDPGGTEENRVIALKN